MNRLIMKLLLPTIIIVAHACASDDAQDEHRNYSRLLNNPPFAGLTDSINREPANVQLLLRRAILLSQNNMHQAATPDYKKAWELTGDEGIALEYASNLLLASQEKEAIGILEEGNEKFPHNTEFSRRLAELYLHRGEYRKANEAYDSMIQRDSSNFEAWYDKGNLYLRLKDTAKAIAALETSFRLLPINYSGMALANIYVARKDPRALDICNTLISMDTAGVQTEPVYMKGVYYTQINQNDEALKQFDECIKRDWKMTDAYIEKGIIYYERKDFSNALKTFNMAATVSNTDADAYYWMGRCYEAMGNNEEAITNYRRALSLDETFSEARERISRLNR